MKWQTKILIVIGLVIAVIVVVSWKGSNCCDTCSRDAASTTQPADSQPASATQPAGPLPRLVDLGSTTCIPCKQMEPVLEELRRDYAGRLVVEFVDIRKSPQIAEAYGIRVIPTQIFISADGKELYRHEGFFSKEDILACWEEFGVTLDQ